MGGGEPRISVIVPVHDGERFLSEALGSILAQEDPNLEIVVVDDGSTDRSGDLARSFGEPIRVVRQPKGGIGAARNRGLQEARGDWVSFLDADDLWAPDKLRRQRAALARDPSIDLVFGLVERFWSEEVPVPRRQPAVWPVQPGLLAGALLARRASFDRVGAFETGWQVGEFVSWVARAREGGLRELVLDEVVLRRRIHGENTVLRRRDAFSDYTRILKNALDRRRSR